MDKNLKKLSRVQLLQLMVQLSEDRDALVAENEALRKRASEQKPPVATSMKVGSIAEAALQANGYFESAQSAADEYLREIKRMRDQVAARVASMPAASQPQAQVRQAAPEVKPTVQQLPEVVPAQQLQAQAAIEEQRQQLEQAKAAAAQEARAMSDRILARANAQSKAIIDDAQTRADSIIADANRQSHAIVAQAKCQAEAVVNAAQQQVAAQNRSGANVEPRAAEPAMAGISSQQQVSARQEKTVVSPSTTAEITMRARHVRAVGVGR